MKKLAITTLVLSILVCSTSFGAFAADNSKGLAVSAVATISAEMVTPKDVKAFTEKHSMAEYEKTNARGRGLSKGQKIGIGIAVAAAAAIIITAVAIKKTDFSTF